LGGAFSDGSGGKGSYAALVENRNPAGSASVADDYERVRRIPHSLVPSFLMGRLGYCPAELGDAGRWKVGAAFTGGPQRSSHEGPAIVAVEPDRGMAEVLEDSVDQFRMLGGAAVDSRGIRIRRAFWDAVTQRRGLSRCPSHAGRWPWMRHLSAAYALALFWKQRADRRTRPEKQSMLEYSLSTLRQWSSATSR